MQKKHLIKPNTHSLSKLELEGGFHKLIRNIYKKKTIANGLKLGAIS